MPTPTGNALTRAPFTSLKNLIFNKWMRMVEEKTEEEKAMTIRVSPDIAGRLDVYAKAARISRSSLVRMLIEGALDEMDDVIISESERRAEASQEGSVTEEAAKERLDRIRKARNVLEEL